MKDFDKFSVSKLIGIVALAFQLFIGGCGGVSSVPQDSGEIPFSPPAPLPTPISKLISVSNPTALGQVVVTGAPQSVGPGARVTVFNGPPAGVVQRIFNSIYPSAWAEEMNATLADSQGAFQVILDAQIGDVLFISQFLDDRESPPLQKTVEGNTIRLFVNPQGLATVKPGLLAITATGDEGALSEFYSLDFTGPQPPFSLPDPERVLVGCQGVEDLVVDTEDQNVSAICLQNEQLIGFPLEGSADAKLHPVTGLLAIAGFPPLNQGVLGLGHSDVALRAFNTANSELECPIKITHPFDLTAQMIRTTQVDQLESSEGKATSIILALSEFSNGDWVLTRLLFEGCPNTTVLNQAILPPGLQPTALAGQEMGTLALIVDGSNPGVVYRVKFDEKNAFLDAVPVGANPQDLLLLESEGVAFVVNQGDNSITRINLSDLSTQTLEGTGLFPSKIAWVEAPNQAAILSTFDRSVVLVDLDF